MVQLFIKGFFLDSDRMPVAVLTDSGGERILPVWIGPSEASSIIVELEEIKSPRPLAHDILARYFKRHGFTMDSLEIFDHSRDYGYCARINYHRRWRHFNMEVRPSDGLAVAVRLQAPILAEEQLLSDANLCSLMASLRDPCKGLIFYPQPVGTGVKRAATGGTAAASDKASQRFFLSEEKTLPPN
jgi:bifunctional DNase/RNase